MFQTFRGTLAGSPLGDFIFTFIMVLWLTDLRSRLGEEGLVTHIPTENMVYILGLEVSDNHSFADEASFVDDVVIPPVWMPS